MIEKQRVKRILTDLEGINEDLLNLYDELRIEGDAHDPSSRRENLRLMTEYNAKLEVFEKASAQLRAIIEGITHVDMAGEAQRQVDAASHPTEDTRRRIVRLMDTKQPHTLAEDFTSMRPYAFRLAGQLLLYSHTWKSLYLMVCTQLASINPERFKTLPIAPQFRGHKTTKFTPTPVDYNAPLTLPHGLYCEGKVSALAIRDNIRRLLAYFNIPETDLIIYLSEDRDADEEE